MCPQGFVCQGNWCIGKGSCQDVVSCIENSGAPPEVSIPMCMNMATPEAQAQFVELAKCIEGVCGVYQPFTNCYSMAINGMCQAQYQKCKSCVPFCTGKECGDDGCGGLCGWCPGGYDCDGGKCVCIPDCANKECGSDGCGNLCGACPPGFQCTDYGKCYCAPDCVAKECGDDGCGGLCGFCQPGKEYCTENGNCLSFNCKPGQMDCDGNEILLCGDNGEWIPVGVCPGGTWCSAGQCIPWVCKPGETKCEGNGYITCADNGAGWLPVMLCPSGTLCKAGQCVPVVGCQDVPKIGCCDGNTLKVCLDGTIMVEDCGNMGCGWVPNWGYDCGGVGPDPSGKYPQACPGVCEPQCNGKQCGTDGCGGDCGFCGPKEICVDGLCKPVCIPNCGGKKCGSDGCGGVCGICSANQTCLDGQCIVPPSCKTMLECAKTCFPMGMPCFDLCTKGASMDQYAEFKAVWTCLETACAAASDPGCVDKALKGACYQVYLACVSCVPACAGKECGPDNCGGACGKCKDGFDCVSGKCTPVCIPKCEGLQCGGNGCGGQCGVCKPGYECLNGICEWICVPQCAGKQCGSDGCGGMCGLCPPGTTCSDNGVCVPQAICGDGFCDKDAGENPLNCAKDCGSPTNGCEPTPFAGCGGCKCEACVCGMDPYCCEVSWDGLCVDECFQCGGCCTPNCAGKECGPDGCGGKCGVCPQGKECNVAGKCENVCVPDCDGKQCGPDECGGTCGICPPNQTCMNNKCFSGKSCAQLITCATDCVQDMGAQCLYGCLEQGTPEAQSEFFNVVQCVVWDCGFDLTLDCMLTAMKGPCQDEYNACMDCTPDCKNKQCGPNGCGGSCGNCPANTYCDNYKCKPICKPDCTGKVCGDNGCGGSCGTCAPTDECKDGKCVPPCKPNCTGKQCGDDGCGGLCGYCPQGFVCQNFKCVQVGPTCGDFQCDFWNGESCDSCPDDCGPCGDGCSPAPFPGCGGCKCQQCVCGMDPYCCDAQWDDICVGECFDCGGCGCVPQCQGKECGDDGCGGSCGTCPPKYSCQKNVCQPICMPSCLGKQCGPDGCGGSCGTCPDGFKCDAGACVPYCTPDCKGKKCGPDGCNGLCGMCGPDEVCLNGQCKIAWDCELLLDCLWDCPEDNQPCYDGCWEKASPEAQEQYMMIWECILEVCGPQPAEPCPGQAIFYGECKDEFNACLKCTPSCTGKQCGPDGCQGTCGTCPPGYNCDVYGYCDCMPNCTGKECGNDGCGGVCGECPGGYTCNIYGKCVCLPNCMNKQCGPDGCGGSCGACPVGFTCNPKGLCVPACQPQCISSDGQKKECGPDGCGGVCGVCPPGLVCTPQGKCQQQGPVCGDKKCANGENCLTCSLDCGQCSGDCCAAHDSVGCDDPSVTKCVCGMDSFCCEVMWDDYCAQEAKDQCKAQCGCKPQCTGKQCGPDGCGGACGFCPPNAWCDANGQCVVVCQPQCTGKQCGPDGCGGTCGTCPIGSQCNSQGTCVCVPDCWNKDCGDDGCGGSCGTCGAFQTCTPSGKCKYVTPLCGDGNCMAMIGEDCDVCPQDCGVCCPNGQCEAKFLETCKSCEADCGKCCGNNFCDVSLGETCENCPLDCGVCPAKCGDKKCEGTETCTNCPQDCGACPTKCGDGKCDAGKETCVDCPQDCGACQGSCCTAHQNPGCSNLDVQKCVCEMDSYCCTNSWDGICAGEADQCGSCNGNCCQANATPGCDDETIEECVCQFDDYCCNVKWDASCVMAVESYGCGKCSIIPGCGDGKCNQMMGETCETCPQDCGDCCIPNCWGKQCGDDGCGGSCGTCPPNQTCNQLGQCTSSQGLSCSQILQCSLECGVTIQCMMDCNTQGSPEGQQEFIDLMMCALQSCLPPTPQCIVQSFMTKCNAQYQACMAP